MNVIVDMWRYAESSNHAKEFESYDFLKDKKITKCIHEECFSFVSEEENRIVFVFAGTQGNLKSWLLDFLALPISDETTKHTKTKELGTIHSGFYSIWEKSKTMVDEIISRAGTKQIFVTGMSQGGAVATLCARHLVKNRNVNKTNLTLVSFGAPAQGLKEYASQINELISTHFRVVDGYDIVPTMPPIKLGFVHGGSFIWLSAPWWHKFIYKVKAHFYSSYTKGLMKKFTKPDELAELKIVLDRVNI